MGKPNKKQKKNKSKPIDLRLTMPWIGGIHGFMFAIWVALFFLAPAGKGGWSQMVAAQWPWILISAGVAWCGGVFFKSRQGGPYRNMVTSYVAAVVLALVEGGLLVVLVLAKSVPEG